MPRSQPAISAAHHTRGHARDLSRIVSLAMGPGKDTLDGPSIILCILAVRNAVHYTSPCCFSVGSEIMTAELSFEEFRAVQRLRKNDEADEMIKENPEEKSNLSRRAGVLAEVQEVQLVMLALIILDLAAASFELAVSCHHIAPTVLVRLVESFTGFTVFVFAFELGALALAFGPRTFCSHPGCVVDAFIVGLCLRAELLAPETGAELRLLGFARLWRFARLHESGLEAVRRETVGARAEASTQQERALKAQVEQSRLQTALQEAVASRKRLEHMCKAYKDEIDTLNEALAIAAMDIAEAADSELGSNPDEDEAGPAAVPPVVKPPPTTKFIVDAKGGYRQLVDQEEPVSN